MYGRMSSEHAKITAMKLVLLMLLHMANVTSAI